MRQSKTRGQEAGEEPCKKGSEVTGQQLVEYESTLRPGSQKCQPHPDCIAQHCYLVKGSEGPTLLCAGVDSPLLLEYAALGTTEQGHKTVSVQRRTTKM